MWSDWWSFWKTKAYWKRSQQENNSGNIQSWISLFKISKSGTHGKNTCAISDNICGHAWSHSNPNYHIIVQQTAKLYRSVTMTTTIVPTAQPVVTTWLSGIFKITAITVGMIVNAKQCCFAGHTKTTHTQKWQLSHADAASPIQDLTHIHRQPTQMHI